MSWASLRLSLAVAAGYDAVFAVLMLLAPGWLSRTFRLPLPEPAFYLWLLAVLLLMLASLYALACRDPRRFGGVVDVAIVGRVLGAVVFGVAAWRQPELAYGLWPVAIGDAAFAVWHAVSWRPHRTPW
jgi:hypothetical protein